MRLPDYVKPGDLLFEKGSGWISGTIKWLTKSRFSHVAIVVDQDTVLEAWPGGVREIPCPYKPGDYEILTCSSLTDEKRQNIIQYARQFIGTPYDYVRIFALLLELLFHIKNRIFKHGHVICSVYAALAYLRGGEMDLHPDKPVYHLTPEDVFESHFLSPYPA